MKAVRDRNSRKEERVVTHGDECSEPVGRGHLRRLVPGIHGKRGKRSLMKVMGVRNSWKKGKEVTYRSYECPESMKRRKRGHS
jgi:hypothetical protein